GPMLHNALPHSRRRDLRFEVQLSVQPSSGLSAFGPPGVGAIATDLPRVNRARGLQAVGGQHAALASTLTGADGWYRFQAPDLAAGLSARVGARERRCRALG